MGQEDLRIARIQGGEAIGAARESSRIAAEYLAAMNARDLHSVGKTLHPDLHFVGPTGEARGREASIGKFQEVLAHLERLDRTAESLADNLVLFKYYMVMPPPIGSVQGTMRTTHAADGLIQKIEMIEQARTDNRYSPKT